ncbi:MAG: SCO family protein [Gammaproteobacteria bacterium]|jgi:protein SCO1/2
MANARKSSRLRLVLLFAVVTALSLAAGYWVSDRYFNRQAQLAGLHATLFAEPRTIQPFDLVDDTGKAFRNEDLQGRWSFVFFGYTHCPDVCPTTLSVLNSVARKLEKQPQSPRFVFISVDPERDTPETLGRYVSYFNGEFIGATGTPDELNKLTQQLGVIYMRVTDNEDSENYLVDHSASVLLFDPDGRFHALFSPPLKAAEIAEDFRRMAKAYH